MNTWTLIRRSLRFHRRAHFGVVLGAAIGSAALIGALLVGDSVRASLRAMALSRLGNMEFVLSAQDRLFQSSLRQRLCATLSTSNCPLAAALVLPGVVSKPDATARANQVNVIGVEPEVWPKLAEWHRQSGAIAGDPEKQWRAGDAAFINEALARQLSVRLGDQIVLRVRKPSALGLDAAISPHNEGSIALRLKVGAILIPEALGDFSLSSQPAPPANLFLPIELLGEKVGAPGRANLLMAVSFYGNSAGSLDGGLAQVWQFEDAGLSVRLIDQPAGATGGELLPPSVEVASSRIFLEPQVGSAALIPRTNLLSAHAGYEGDSAGDVKACQFVTNGVPVLTYLVNLIRAGDRATPYSIVTAAGSPYVPADLGTNEIVINQWLAEDLNVARGSTIELSYFLVDSGSKLVERTNTFTVREIVPIAGVHADRSLMPEFPGLAKAESTHDWDAGFPLVYPIRDKDEAYWKQYRGTPKAFINLSVGQAMWTNRFGTLTAVRYEIPKGTSPQACREAVARNLLANLSPSDVGLRFDSIRQRALNGADQAQDFGQLFLGFSFFLVFAALLLMAVLFQFGLEQRIVEVGTLLAVGFRVKQVRRLLLLEGAMLALLGGVLGVAGGIAYGRIMLWALTTIWRGAISSTRLRFYMTPATIVIGLCASVFVAIVTIWLALRKQAKQPARDLLAGETGSLSVNARSRGKWIGLVAGLMALGIAGWALASGDRQNAESFFTAGTLLLIAGLALASAWLGSLAGESRGKSFTLRRLGVSGCARRRKRSLATMALLASGCFVIVSIGAFRLDANADATKRTSGTGGFALIGESSLPVVKDLDTKTGREQFGLGDQEMTEVNVISLRVRMGDEASCLSLSRALKPRLLGVKPESLAGRFTFTDAAKGLDLKKQWNLLETPADAPDEIPAVADANAIEYALGKKLGDTIDYTDDQGRAFKVRLVGAVANSILQGSLLIDETAFVKKFPGESGYRMFLIDAPSGAASQVSRTLSRALQDVGLELTPATDRLNAFNAVQNTYLGTFQILGGLGLLLGSAGLGVVVLRNVLERRGEFGLLTAVGFRHANLQWLILIEHGALLGMGLGLGVVAAIIAVLPALLTPGAQFPLGSLALTLTAIFLNGVVWTWLAVRHALKGNPLEALRNE